MQKKMAHETETGAIWSSRASRGGIIKPDKENHIQVHFRLRHDYLYFHPQNRYLN